LAGKRFPLPFAGMSSKALHTRFAPSPTGLLHVGNVRTALFNRLLASAGGGRFLLRLEDTDAVRGEGRYADALQEDLRWLGLDWDEGPGAPGAHGPYAQSERGEIYADYFERLVSAGAVYPCFCTEHELKIERKTQLAAGRAPRYSGRCRRLSSEEVEARFAAGTPATLRFHVVDGCEIAFEDRVRGSQRFLSDDIGDFVIRRSDGTPAFFFSNAIDDSLMDVSLVVRGEDHLTNTPRQILLLEALNLSVPDYAHIALVTGNDSAPLSKRNGSQTVRELREQGYLPLAIVNYLARLGHSYDENGLMIVEELAAHFDIARLHRSPARYDSAQLRHWQQEAVASTDDAELWQWMNSVEISGGKVRDLVPDDLEIPFAQAIRENIVMPQDAYLWAGNLFARSGIFDHEAREAIVEAGAGFYEQALSLFDADTTDFSAYAKKLGAALGLKGRALFMPLRAALSGESAPQLENPWHDGPSMAAIWGLLGYKRITRRLELARELCRS
jgi:nondiscriminating glutamyl-tRNA synthetase